MGARATLDARAGGEFRLDVDGVHIAAGEYREVEPPRRVVMSWGWEGSQDVPPGSTTVEITLEPVAEGTVLRLRHMGLPNDRERENHRAGWSQYTRQLAALFTPR